MPLTSGWEDLPTWLRWILVLLRLSGPTLGSNSRFLRRRGRGLSTLPGPGVLTVSCLAARTAAFRGPIEAFAASPPQFARPPGPWPWRRHWRDDTRSARTESLVDGSPVLGCGALEASLESLSAPTPNPRRCPCPPCSPRPPGLVSPGPPGLVSCLNSSGRPGPERPQLSHASA